MESTNAAGPRPVTEVNGLVSRGLLGLLRPPAPPFVGGLNPFHQAPPEAQLSRDREGAVSSGYLPHPGVY